MSSVTSSNPGVSVQPGTTGTAQPGTTGAPGVSTGFGTTGIPTTPTTSKANYQRIAESAFKEIDKINGELFILTYGSIVSQLLKDYEDVEEVNQQLEKMGYNIGLRLIEEFLARTNLPRCSDFRETGEIIAKVGFKMFLGVTAQATNWDAKKNEFSLVLEDNPLVEYVELPDNCVNLIYANILCGVIRGALEMVQLRVECNYLRCVLKGDEVSEIRVTLKEIMQEDLPVGED